MRRIWITASALACLCLSPAVVAQGDVDNPYGKEADEGKEKGDKAGEAAEKDAAKKAEKAAKPAPAKPAKPTKVAPAKAGPADTRASAMRSYQEAMKSRRLAATAPLSRPRLREELESVEAKLLDGRRDEAIGQLVFIVEAPRFDAFKETSEGRAARFLLGDSLGRAGAHEPARGYLVGLLTGDPKDTAYRRAVRSLVDFGLESDKPDAFLKDLKKVPKSAPAELSGDIAYLRGRTLERAGKRKAALKALARVGQRSRFWAQATYLSGLIQVDLGKLKKGENLFCKVADPKLTPKQAPLFGGSDFFRVRDLARLALGRVAHEQYRFDDARYYYYLVPGDSDHLPEALYESATGRYEAKDYDGARELLDELKRLDRTHSYQDEAWILDAYVDLAVCNFPKADAKLNQFLKQYEPVRDQARRLSKDPRAIAKLVKAMSEGGDPAAAGIGGKVRDVRAVAALLRVDATYSAGARRLAQLDHQLSGLQGTLAQLDDTRERLAKPKGVRAQAEDGLQGSPTEKLARIEAQLDEVRRLIREAEAAAKGGKQRKLDDLRKALEALELRAKALRQAVRAEKDLKPSEKKDLAGLVSQDRKRASKLYGDGQKVRAKLVAQQEALAKAALVRLDKRLSRLVRRARLGRIETVLGKKRALELEVEALSQGLLPQSAVDSLDAARYLKDDEEYWPFDGEDWADEYVGGEGLR